MKACLCCGDEYPRRPNEKPGAYSKRKYCGVPCRMKALIGGNTGKKAHNNRRVERICKTCGKKELVSPAYSKRPFCGRNCMAAWYSIHQRGDRHWHWMGGITEARGRDSLYPGYREWRRSVYKRDGYTCVTCGASESGILRAHHIKPRETHPELLLDVCNGMTVCDDCHKRIHYGKVQDRVPGHRARARATA